MAQEKDRFGDKMKEAEKGREDDYFARRDRELLEKMRRRDRELLEKMRRRDGEAAPEGDKEKGER